MSRWFLRAVLVTLIVSVGIVRATESQPTTLPEAVAWLQTEAHRIIRASKRTMADGTAAFPPQVGLGYEAFWLRDYEYTLEGSIASYSDQELTDACRLFVRKMSADSAATDCVKFDGTPIYKPGFGTMGTHPVADGSQFTVAVAWHTFRKTQDRELLEAIIDPLVRTMHAVPRNRATGLVHIKPGQPQDRCPYGFTDTIGKQGDVLFCSLLYVQACRQLGDLLAALDRSEDARRWRETGRRITRSIDAIFWDPNTGLFRAATVQCCEHDIWGSAFAVYLGIADSAQSKAIATYFQKNYADIVQHGQIRHLPGGLYWEKAACKPDTYQNGAYWATPTGWFVYTLDLVDRALADQTVIDMVRHFQTHGACEWIFGDQRRLPNYLASAALPLAGIRAMLERRDAPPARPVAETTGSAWAISNPILSPGPSGSFDEVAVKDPSIVFFDGMWHLFYTARSRTEYTTGYVAAQELTGLQSASRHELPRIRGKTRYGCAPQVFYYEPQHKWYLIFQNRDANYQPAFSTTTTISEPDSWSQPAPLLPKDTQAKWIDFWVIGDQTNAYLFYTQAHHGVVVRSTRLEDFPNHWSAAKTVFDSVHEAVHIYKVKDRPEFHMIYELNTGGIRSFGLAVAENLTGPWQRITDRYATGDQLRPVDKTSTWTQMVSHGEALRTGYDQRMEYDPTSCRWLIQGIRKDQLKGPYPTLPWKLGIITKTE